MHYANTTTARQHADLDAANELHDEIRPLGVALPCEHVCPPEGLALRAKLEDERRRGEEWIAERTTYLMARELRKIEDAGLSVRAYKPLVFKKCFRIAGVEWARLLGQIRTGENPFADGWLPWELPIRLDVVNGGIVELAEAAGRDE